MLKRKTQKYQSYECGSTEKLAKQFSYAILN